MLQWRKLSLLLVVAFLLSFPKNTIQASESSKHVAVPPMVNAGGNQTIALPQTTLTLTGSATDSDGTISSYQWTKRYGPAVVMTNANTASLGLSNLVTGGYGFRLTATDSSGETAYADVKVTVNVNPSSTCNEGQY